MNPSVTTYRGPKELAATVEFMRRPFPTCIGSVRLLHHWEDTIVVELALQGTHKGRWSCPSESSATGKRMNAPCCDVFQVTNGKITSFNCYPSGTVV